MVPLPKALTPATELDALTGIVILGRGSPSGFPIDVEPLVVVTFELIVEPTTEPVVWFTIGETVLSTVPVVEDTVLPTVPVVEDTVLSTVPVVEDTVFPTVPVTDEIVPGRV
jgi:hypothetical protein